VRRSAYRVGRIILKWIITKRLGAMVWIVLAQIWDRWRALLNAIMNLQVA
jgi:hypothetical protein